MRPTERRRRELERAARRQAWQEQATVWDTTMRATAELVAADYRPAVRKALRAVQVGDDGGAIATLRDEVLPAAEYSELGDNLQALLASLEAETRDAEPPPAPEYPPLLTGSEVQAWLPAAAAPGPTLPDLEAMPELSAGTDPRFARGFAWGWRQGRRIRLRVRSVKLSLAWILASCAERLAG